MLSEIIEKQRKYFSSHETYDINFRILQLKRLKLQINAYYGQILSAFEQDLNKKEFDVVTTEVGLVMSEINYMIKHLKKLAKPKKVRTSIINFPSKGYKVYDPYGVVLIASPWNYPFQLTMSPLVGAIAGGNTVVIKPSRSTPNVTQVIKKIISVFDEEYICVITKEEDINEIFNTKFDFIFYTGSYTKAQELLAAQANHLTPMVLELGGKSPCIVDKDAKVDLSAKRIVWGKFLNAGQTCVAPDYVLVHSSIKDEWLESAKKYINKFFYNGDEVSDDFVKVINKKSLERLQGLIDPNKLYFGGKCRGQIMEPTILNNVTRDDLVMQDEIFGPIMPVLEFDDLDKELQTINELDHPLAFYYFGEDKENIEKVKLFSQFGGGCINDVIMHLTEKNLPFGGVGRSGSGLYHGKQSFYTFTHQKSIMQKSTKMDINIKYPPATKGKIKITKSIFKV